MHSKPRDKRPLAVSATALAAIPLLLLATRAPEIDKFYVCGAWPKKWILLSLALVWVASGGVAVWRSRRAAFGFALASLMSFLVLGLLELLGLAGLLNYPAAFGTRDTGTGIGYQAIPHQVYEGNTIGNITFEWTLRDRPEYPIEFRSDQHGFRNPTDRDSAEVYLVGDSFVVAGLVDFPQTLAGRLESTLQRPVMNVALTGLSPAGARDLLYGAKLPLENRLVVQFLFEGNDLRDTVWDRQEHEDQSAPLRTRSLTVNLLDAFARWSLPAGYDPGYDRSATFAGERYYFKEIYGWSEELAPEVETVMGTLREVRDRVEAAGGRYLVAMFPTKLRVLAPYAEFPPETLLVDPPEIYGPQTERFRAACAEAGIPYLDLTAPLQAATARGETTFFTDDTHLDAHGLEVCAEALLAWEPLRSWLARPR